MRAADSLRAEGAEVFASTADVGYQALLESHAIHGAKKAALEDIERKPLGYGRLVTGALVLGRRAYPASLAKVAGTAVAR